MSGGQDSLNSKRRYVRSSTLLGEKRATALDADERPMSSPHTSNIANYVMRFDVAGDGALKLLSVKYQR
jgi:hypothetical protein